MHKIYIIELCNFEDFPPGGHLSFAKQMLKAFGNQIALVGVSTGNESIKKWIKKEIEGIEYDFFSVKKVKKHFRKPLIPNRLKGFYYLSRCHKELLFLRNENVFIQTPEVLFAIRNWGIRNVCFRSPGVVNMLEGSRYWYSKFFKDIYESILYKSLQKVSIILASADKKSIIDFCIRSKNKIPISSVIQFPTRIDTNIFKPMEKYYARRELGIDFEIKLVVTTGRLNWNKGWKFMIDCFEMFMITYPDSMLYMIGDGEDRSLSEKYVFEKKIISKVNFTGNIKPEMIALYLNACDLYIMGSYLEGWSTSLMEAIACGVPVCITNFGGAKDLVIDGVNGYVCNDHIIIEFADKMKKSLSISRDKLAAESVKMRKYGVTNLRNELVTYWNMKE